MNLIGWLGKSWPRDPPDHSRRLIRHAARISGDIESSFFGSGCGDYQIARHLHQGVLPTALTRSFTTGNIRRFR
jgi:hypothetical protein